MPDRFEADGEVTRVRIGAFLLAGQFPGQDHAAVLERTVAAAVAAEEAGFDDVWIAEHHFMTYGVCPSAITCAAFVLERTPQATYLPAIGDDWGTQALPF